MYPLFLPSHATLHVKIKMEQKARKDQAKHRQRQVLPDAIPTAVTKRLQDVCIMIETVLLGLEPAFRYECVRLVEMRGRYIR